MKKLTLTVLAASLSVASFAANKPKSGTTDFWHQYGLHYDVGSQVSYGANHADSGVELFTGASFLKIFSTGVSVSQLTDSSNGKHYQKTKASVGASLPFKISPYVIGSLYRYYNDNKSSSWHKEADFGVSWHLTKTYSVYGEWDNALLDRSSQNFEIGASHSFGLFSVTPSVDFGRSDNSVSANLSVQYNF